MVTNLGGTGRWRARCLAIGLAASALSSTPGAAEARPVVVELFTSQGCSSCPPADRLLSRLGAASGGRVIPLAFHVDYWNRLGWRDPFSSPEWSRRQGAYGDRLGSYTYTPQAVVDGRVDVVGSNEPALRAAIAEAAERPAARVALALAPRDSEVGVDVEVELPPELRGRRLDLLAAVFESGQVTRVTRGENDGRSLVEDYVVRRLQRLAVLSAGAPVESRYAESVTLAPEWSRAELGVAVFLQDAETLAIVGAAARGLP